MVKKKEALLSLCFCNGTYSSQSAVMAQYMKCVNCVTKSTAILHVAGW